MTTPQSPTPDLGGVPETMLWTLHNRANEVMRPDSMLDDPDCLRIYESIDYDYQRSFGKPDSSHPDRSLRFDERVERWMVEHPDGAVLELGAGLETQFQRVDNGVVRWYCIDVPQALDVRERFLPRSPRCEYVAASAFDVEWMEQIEPSIREVFVSAQGLFMYFIEPEVEGLVAAICDRFEHVTLMFDAIPPWFSERTLSGFAKTEHYTAPPMPWGIKRSKIEQTLRLWSPHIRSVETQSYGALRGPLRWALPVFSAIPVLRDVPPCIAVVESHSRSA